MSHIPGTRPVSLGETADKLAKAERDIATLQGRVTFSRDVHARLFQALEKALAEMGRPSILEPMLAGLRTELERKSDNPLARAGYEHELERLERLTHRPSPDHQA